MWLTWGAKCAVAGGVVGAAVRQKLLEILDERRNRCVCPVVDPLPDPADPDFVLRWNMHAVIGHMQLINLLLRVCRNYTPPVSASC